MNVYDVCMYICISKKEDKANKQKDGKEVHLAEEKKYL